VILLFAWAFEMTPDGIKRDHEVDRSTSITPQTGKKLDRTIILIMGMALAYFAYDKFILSDAVSTGAAPASAQLEAASNEVAEQQKSIAVLPLANRSAREEDQYFTDGIHDDLLTQLAKIADLKVISRTSVMRYRDTELPIPEIAKQLGVSTILEGGIQRSGDQIRINMQLIEASTDKHLWAETYDRQMTAENLFAIQSEITRNITNALKATLSPEEAARIENQPTQSLEAYQEYMRGQQLLALRTSTSIEQGKQHFQHAVSLDPGFSQAIAGLANAYHLMHEYVGVPEEDSLDPAMTLANEALAVSPNLGEAYMVRGELYRHANEVELSESDFKRAAELIPGNATVYHWFSFLKYGQGRQAEANSLMRQAHRLNPMSAVIHLNVAQMPFHEGRDEEALAELERIKLLHPDYPTAYSTESWIHRNHGNIVDSLRASLKVLELDPGNTRGGFHCFDFLSLGAMEATQRCVTNYKGPGSRRRIFIEVMLLLLDDKREAGVALLETTKDVEGDGDFRAFAHLAVRDYEAARPEYEKDHADWFGSQEPVEIDAWDVGHAVDTALILLKSGDQDRAELLLTAALETMGSQERNRGATAFGYSDVQAYALLGQTDAALAALEEAVDAEFLAQWQALKFLPHYDAIRDDLRFTSAISRLEATAKVAREQAVAEGLL
jgi:TolB-like protein